MPIGSGKQLMQRAETSMKAAHAHQVLLDRLEQAGTPEELKWIKHQAFDCQGLYPEHAARFMDVVNMVNAKLNPSSPAPYKEMKTKLDALYTANQTKKKRLRVNQRRGDESKKSYKEIRWAEICAAYDVLREKHKTAGKSWIQRHLAGELPGVKGLHPRKKGFSFRTIIAATADKK